jgi:hypothetical protein
VPGEVSANSKESRLAQKLISLSDKTIPDKPDVLLFLNSYAAASLAGLLVPVQMAAVETQISKALANVARHRVQ